MKILNKIFRTIDSLRLVRENFNHVRFNQGLILSELKKQATTFPEAEFRAFSQWGEDGIIQLLVRVIGSDISQSFIEFGVENFTEANCRFLLMKDLWRGLVIDGSTENINYILEDPVSWRYGLKAKQAFITAENINSIISEEGFAGSVGILSIDIDGNDYWVFKAIDSVQADILILEYNSIFGSERSVSVPYDPLFRRTEKHYSNLYWGASLRALTELADAKGYFLVGCNSHGNNAFYLNKKHYGKIKPAAVSDAYRSACFRESRDQNGNLTFLEPKSGMELIKGLELVNISPNNL